MTTSLHRGTPPTRRSIEVDATNSRETVPESFEIAPPSRATSTDPAGSKVRIDSQPVHVNGGIPRNSWRRQRRASRWHRPYIAVLLVLDWCGVGLASWLAITAFDQADAGFRNDGADEWFFPTAYVLLPLGWLIMLW